MSDYLSLPVAARFAIIMEYLGRTVARHGLRGPVMDPFFHLMCQRLGRLAARFARLVDRAQAGTLPPPRPPGAFAPPRASRPRPPPDPAKTLPRGFAWLVRRVQPAAASGSQLQFLLADPAMVAFLAATPSAARVLRPLCHMLGVTPLPALPPPPPRRPPTRTRPPKPPAQPAARQPARLAIEPAADPPDGPAAGSPATALRHRRPWWMPPGRPWRHLIPDLQPTLDPASWPQPPRSRRK